MKKFFYSVFAVAAMMFATTSCSSEDVLAPEAGQGTKKVTFKVEMPGETASRTIADGVEVAQGNMANKLAWALYEENKYDAPLKVGKVDETTDKEFSVQIDMVKGLQYKVLFFAYNEAGTIFNVEAEEDLKALEYKSNVFANEEAYDAFVACHTHKVNDEDVTTVTLRRPFAQINAATTDEDLTKAEGLNATVVKSQLEIAKVPTCYNVLTGEVSVYQDVIYKEAAILKDYLNDTNELLEVEGTNYNYLNMVYALAGNGTATASTHAAKFTFYRADAPQIVRELEIENLPIERNYRTNIIGNLITQTEAFKVVIDAEFKTPAKNPVEEDATYTVAETADDLIAKLQNPAVKNIGLVAGNTYEGTFGYYGSEAKKIFTVDNESRSGAEKAIIKGRVNVCGNGSFAFENIKFEISDASTVKKPNFHNQFSGTNYQYPAIVMIANVATSFEGCEFMTDLSKGVCGINYGSAQVGDLLTVNNCYFEGDFYPIRSRVLVSVTNSTFKNTYPQDGALAAIWTWGLNDKSMNNPGTVIFKNNKNEGTGYTAIVMAATNWLYNNIAIDVQGNQNFTASYGLNNACTFKDITFAAGSETFDFSGAKSVSTAEDLKKAIAAAAEGDVITLASGTYEGLFDLTGKNLILQEAEGAEVIIKGMLWADNCTVTVKGFTLTNPNGVQHPNTSNSQYYTTINNQYPLVGAYLNANIKFEGCTFDIVAPTVYGFYGYSNNSPEFDGCTFNCNQIRPIANNGPALTINGCTFKNQYHYSARIFENSEAKQTVVFTNNTILGKNNENKTDFEGVNISKKAGSATVLGDFTIKGNTANLKYRHHKNVTMSDECTYDTDIANFAFEKED